MSEWVVTQLHHCAYASMIVFVLSLPWVYFYPHLLWPWMVVFISVFSIFLAFHNGRRIQSYSRILSQVSVSTLRTAKPTKFAAAAAICIPYLFSLLFAPHTFVIAHEHKLQGLVPCWGSDFATLLSTNTLVQDEEEVLHHYDSNEKELAFRAQSVEEEEEEEDAEIKEEEENEQESTPPLPVWNVILLFRHKLQCECHYPILCQFTNLWPKTISCNATTGLCKTDVSWIYEVGVKCKPPPSSLLELPHSHSHPNQLSDKKDKEDIIEIEEKEVCYMPHSSHLKLVQKQHQLKHPRYCVAYFDLTHTADAVITCILLVVALTLAFTIAHCTLSALEDMRMQSRQALYLSQSNSNKTLLPNSTTLAHKETSSRCGRCDNCVIDFCLQLATAVTICMRSFQQPPHVRYSTSTGKKD